MELNKVYLGDCLEYMRNLPDKSIDLVLTDPPYGIGEAKGKNISRGKLAKSKDYGVLDWDNSIPPRECFEQMTRISKNQVIFGGNYFVENLSNSPCWLVWDKNNSGDFADCELAWTSFKTAVRKFVYTWNGMLQQDMKNKEKRYHPTQKPIALFKWILLNYSEEGQTILDPFAGSGTTAIAATILKRNFLCFEREKEYFDIINHRLGEIQTELF